MTEKLSEARLAASMVTKCGLPFRLSADAAWLVMRIPTRATEVWPLAAGWALASVAEVENIESALNIRTLDWHEL